MIYKTDWVRDGLIILGLAEYQIREEFVGELLDSSLWYRWGTRLKNVFTACI